MSYESKLNSRFSQFVNPTQLSLILSVVLHLLLYKFGLPALDFQTDSGKREVSIVELTPEQQSRVPNLYPELDTPGINNPYQNQNDAPAPPFALPPSLIPGFENFPNLPPVNIPPPPNFNFPPLPPISNNIKFPPIGNLSPLPLPPSVNPLDFKVEPLKLPPVPTKTPTIKPSPGSKQPKQPATATSPARTTKPEKLPEVKPDVKPRLAPQVIAAKREKNAQTRVRSLSQRLQQSDVATTDEDARKKYLAWVSQVKEIKPENIEIKGTYPRDACIRRLEGKSIYGVVVDPQGALLGLDLLKGSEYPIFNAQAGQDISKRTLVNKTNKPKPYQVTVDYKYDAEICPSLTLPSLRRDDKPKTEPNKPTAPEAKPQPTPAAPVVPQKPPEAKPQTTPAAPVVPQKPPEAKPQPTAPTQPSLRDRLRKVPLLDTKPSQLEKIPLPDEPKL